MPALLKCREEVSRSLDSFDAKNTRDKPFILYNNSARGIVVFS